MYYELDKKAYEKQRKARRERGISLGLDWYEKGQAAESMNNCSSAIQMYAQGLKAIEPYLYLDLTTERHDDRFDVATELYDAYVNVFTGFGLWQKPIPMTAFWLQWHIPPTMQRSSPLSPRRVLLLPS